MYFMSVQYGKTFTFSWQNQNTAAVEIQGDFNMKHATFEVMSCVS